MSTDAIIWGFIFVVVGAVLAYVLDRPKVKPVGTKGWVVLAKRVSNSLEEKYPTTDTPQDGDYSGEYDFFGITIMNEGFRLRRVAANITQTEMTVWNSKMEVFREGFDCRYTSRSFADDPLFVGDLPVMDKSKRKAVTLGGGQKLDIVVAARNTKTNRYSLFTTQTDSLRWFQTEGETLNEPMPYFIKLTVHGDKIEENIYLKLDAVDDVTESPLTIIPPF